MNRLLLSLLLGSVVYMSEVQAFIISNIRVEGLQRVSMGTVYSALPIEIGTDVDSAAIAASVKALFRTGYFKDIDVGRDEQVLVITVVERPSISDIAIKGNKAIKTEDLISGLSKAGLAEGEIFQQATLDSIKLELERQYVGQGRYGVIITADVKAQPKNRVQLSINIKEGSVAKISHINVVGNTVFSLQDLLDLFELKESSWYGFFSSSDKYSREKLSGDLERLRSHYLDRGYINFDISSTQVAISADKGNIYITVSIDEGEQYKISDVRLTGDLIIPEDEAKGLLLVKEGQVFSRKDVTATEELMSSRLGNEGYTFASVAGIPKANIENKTVSLTFFVDPGRRAYVRRINFSGNVRTDDEVLRREMRQLEGASANTEKIEISKTRLERLGYFREVRIETLPVAGTSDQLDLHYAVEEQPSGSITASVGYSQSDGLLLGGSISQSNFMGTGNKVSLGLNKSDISQLYSFSFTDPYYTVDGVSRGFGAYYRSTDYKDSDISNYSADAWGTDIRFSYPLSETQSINFSLGVEGTKISTGTYTTTVITDYLKKEGDNFTNYKASLGWSESELNKGLLPTRGFAQSVSLQAAVPGSSITFFKMIYRGQYFQPLTETLTARFSTRLGYGAAYGTTSDMPFFENFYSGGFGSIRGYKDNTLGPKAKENKVDGSWSSIGGNAVAEGSVEILFALPFIKDQRSLRTSVFLDFGNVFDTFAGNRGGNYEGAKLRFDEIRYSAGVGLTWVTPLGPLTFSLAQALNEKNRDETQIFQFSLGAPF
ncbi:MAG: outer membrane protein assembly factor BamA [Candidatus Endonucleobacter bathymodioli]|uniref:Outer membrane protein assembly factor BamA n=1 Tax=Candidatus Endonucleibacter bathymodioli TaxID=539814 RepID=A0AA90P0I3_9GAMM|nr:outer membrane protein assembly factor BamA [Candidatus Endonucleobacter bathymodioli]